MSPSSVLFALCLAFFGCALTVLVTDPGWTKKLWWFLPVLWTLAVFFGVFAIPVVRRWLAGIESKEGSRPNAGLTQEGIGNVSQDVAGSGNRTIAGDYHERHEHHYDAPATLEEVPRGEKNGANSRFAISCLPKPESSFELFLNGVKQTSRWYALDGKTITFAVPPIAGDDIIARYTY